MIHLHRIYQQFRDLVLYGCIGCLSSILDFLVYSILTDYILLNYLLSNCISVLVGIVTSFTLNRTYNFKVKDHVKRRFAIFLLVGLTGLIMSNLILYISIDLFHQDNGIAKLISIILVVGFQFLLNKHLTFRRS